MEIKTKYGVGDVLLIHNNCEYFNFVAIVNGIKIDRMGIQYYISVNEQKMCCECACQIITDPEEYHDDTDGDPILSIIGKVGTLSKE